MRSRAALAIAFVTVACVGPPAGVTESGEGVPRVAVDFPSRTSPGSVHEAVIEVTNPGPEEIQTLAVAFTRVGDPALPEPIVDAGARGKNPSVEAVEPRPSRVSGDAVVYYFGPLDEGTSTSITFALRVPTTPGPAANAVQVYDGSDVERAAGVRLSTEVRA